LHDVELITTYVYHLRRPPTRSWCDKCS